MTYGVYYFDGLDDVLVKGGFATEAEAEAYMAWLMAEDVKDGLTFDYIVF